jgi:hypothetical protein
MSKRRDVLDIAAAPREEAEEFMALLLGAQSESHDCPYVAYFRKIGERIKKQYLGAKEAKSPGS